MGILRGTSRLLLEEHKRHPFSGSLLELAKMFVFLTPEELEKDARTQGLSLTSATAALSHDPVLARHGCLDDVSFFKKLGFSEVRSSDAVAWEGADILWDLNQPAAEELRERFDVVFEGGTIQHVFNLPQVFRNIHSVLKPGGRIIHGICPSTNHVDLGFYMFSPTLFSDFYAANHWTVETFYFFDYMAYWIDGLMQHTPMKIRRYEPGCLDPFSYGRMGNRQIGLFIVATKNEDSTAHIAPQQGFYRDLWKETAEPLKPKKQPRAEVGSGSSNPLVKRWKILREWAVRFGPKKLPPVIAKY